MRDQRTMGPAMILDQIRTIMSDVFDVDVDEANVTAATTASDIEEWDSLSHIRLIVAIERKFKVKFKNSEIESLKSVGDLIALIQAKAA
jgi:acyl carrier protein